LAKRARERVMHGGAFIMLRQYVEQMRYAKPWQQMLFVVGLIALGLMLLVVLKHPIGVLPIVLGVVWTRGIAVNVGRSRRSQHTRHADRRGPSSPQ
jgi:hypothetical protein